ncbi:MAG: class I SAM-dependent methyltransferase [Acidimicrobiia bacterium]|nr:class I SAM-dependent methyltransferase [Acidimicrobiia bacterium]
MSRADRERWDGRYVAEPGDDDGGVAGGPPDAFVAFEHLFPTGGRALELACGRGAAAVWLARRGLDVLAVDVSAVAIGRARRLANACGVADRCRFEVADLDAGLPAGPPVDLVLCHRFRDERLDDAIVERLAPGGTLAMAALSEVGAGAGRFRVAAGELARAFAGLDLLAEREGDGLAVLVARKPAGA